MSARIELTDTERRAAQCKVARILGDVALRRELPDYALDPVIDAVVDAINAERQGAAVGTVVRHPTSGMIAERRERQDGRRYWQRLTNSTQFDRLTPGWDPESEGWKRIYEPKPLYTFNTDAAQLAVFVEHVPDGEIIHVEGEYDRDELPADGSWGIFCDRDGDLYRYVSGPGVGGDGSWVSDRFRGRWQFADRSVRTWGDIAADNINEYRVTFAPYRRVTIKPKGSE